MTTETERRDPEKEVLDEAISIQEEARRLLAAEGWTEDTTTLEALVMVRNIALRRGDGGA